MATAEVPVPRAALLDAYLRGRLARARGQTFGFVVALLVAFVLVAMMMILRAADGPERPFLDGVVARGALLGLWALALPFALALAGRGPGGPLDRASATLPWLRGFAPREIDARAPLLVARFAASRVALPVATLAAFSAVLSLPSLKTVAVRALVGALVVLIASAAAGVLALIGLFSARFGRGWGRTLFVVVLFAPALLPELVMHYPTAATPLGMYTALIDAALSLAP